VDLVDAENFITTSFLGAKNPILKVGESDADVVYDEESEAKLIVSLTMIMHEAQMRDEAARAQRAWFEAKAAPLVYEFVAGLSPELIVDQRFWCYLSCVPLFPIVQWRHPVGTKKDGSPRIPSSSNFAAKRGQLREALLVRLYLRVSLSLDDNDEDFSLAAIDGQDLWRSHIIRVKLGNSPSMTRAMLMIVDDEKVSNVRLIRDWAKRLTEIRSNVLFEVIGIADAQRIALEQLGKARAALIG
jgi:hypothetical protein